MRAHECVSFIFFSEDKILLEKRGKHKRSDAGLWNIPGGHIENAESQLQTLYREVNEELNVQPIRSCYLCSLYHPTSELQLIHYYVVSEWHGQMSSQEADEVKWFSLSAAPVQIQADQIALSEFQRVYHVLQDR